MKLARFFAALVLGLCLVATQGVESRAAQGSGCMPTTGTVSGLTFAQDINAAIAALISSNSGATPPATDCSGVAITGQLWLDQSTTPAHLRQYDGSVWLDLGALDAANHRWTPPVGGGTATIASASTVDLCSVPQDVVQVTGTTGISSFGSTCAPGLIKVVRFSGILTVTYNATSLILPGGANLTTQAGGWAILTSLSSGNWTALGWFNADGSAAALSSGAVTGALGFTPARSGANSDITALSGLTTPLPVTEGGTGATSAAGALSSLGAAPASSIPSSASAGEVQAGSSSTKYATPAALAGSASLQTLTFGTTTSWNLAAGFNGSVILTGNTTLSVSNPVFGQTYTLLVTQDSSGSHTVTWPASFDWGTAGTPTLTTTGGKTDLVTFICVNASAPLFFVVIAKGF
jgi:hypothetical protein